MALERFHFYFLHFLAVLYHKVFFVIVVGALDNQHGSIDSDFPKGSLTMQSSKR